MKPALPKQAVWLLRGVAGLLSLACLVALFRFGFRPTLAWWLALGLTAAYAAWSLRGD